jgi:hypothetical protein
VRSLEIDKQIIIGDPQAKTEALELMPALLVAS